MSLDAKNESNFETFCVCEQWQKSSPRGGGSRYYRQFVRLFIALSSSSSVVWRRSILYNPEAGTSRSVRNPSVRSDEDSMLSGNQHYITSTKSEY